MASSSLLRKKNAFAGSDSFADAVAGVRNDDEQRSVGVCTLCHHAIDGRNQEYLHRSCGHHLHRQCFVRLVTAGRVQCAECTSETTNDDDMTASVDAGYDVHMRALVVAKMQHQVRCGNRAGAVSFAIMYYIFSLMRVLCTVLNADGARSDGDPWRGDNGMNTTTVEPPYTRATVPREPGGRRVMTHTPDSAANSLVSMLTGFVFSPHKAAAAATTSTETSDVDDIQRLPDRAGYECRLTTCGGPDYCVHKYMRDVSSEAAISMGTFDVGCVSAERLDDVEAARNRIVWLLDTFVAPDVLTRVGATWQRMIVCGIQLNALIVERQYLLEDVIDGLQLSWDGLVAFGWTPFTLTNRAASPLVMLTEHTLVHLDANLLLRTFPIVYGDLKTLDLTVDDLLVLRFDAAMLMAIGMSERDIVECVATIAGRGAQWFWRAFGWTTALALARPLTSYAKCPRAELTAAARDFSRVLVLDLQTPALSVESTGF